MNVIVGWILRDYAIRQAARDLRVPEMALRRVLETVGAPVTEQVRRPPAPRKPPAPRALSSSNAAAVAAAAARTVEAARAVLERGGGDKEVLRVRVKYPDASLAELGAVLGIGKDAYAGRLRRALEVKR